MKTTIETTTAPGAFRPFDRHDFEAWAGVETSAPLIASMHDQRTSIIIDGVCVRLAYCDDEFGPSEYWHEYDCAATAEAVAERLVQELLAVRLHDEPDAAIAELMTRFAFVQCL